MDGAPDAVLETIRAGRVGAEGEVAAELGLLEAWELSRAGRTEEGLGVADAVLAGASNRDALAAAGEATPCGE